MGTSVITEEKFTEHEKVMLMLSIFPEILVSDIMAVPPVLLSVIQKTSLKCDPRFYFNLTLSTFKLFGLCVCVALMLSFGGISVSSRPIAIVKVLELPICLWR